VADAKAWLDKVQAAFGRTPIIYTQKKFIDTCLGGASAFGSYPMQLAEPYDIAQPPLPPGSTTWLPWQYDCTIPVPGVPSPPCSDVFNGTQAQLDQLANRVEQTRFADIDGDGRADLIGISGPNNDLTAYRNQGWSAANLIVGWDHKPVISGFQP
jgi:hypothetical protein